MPRLLITAANFVLVAIAVYFGIRIYHGAYGSAPADAMQSESPAPTKTTPEIAGGDIGPEIRQPIVQRDLFKTGPEKKPETTLPPVKPVELKTTALNLKLWGTIVGGVDQPYAIIQASKGNHQELYQQGDIVDGATVKSILREKVILSIDGRDEVLALMDYAAGAPSPGAARRPPGQPAAVNAQAGSPSPGPDVGQPPPAMEAQSPLKASMSKMMRNLTHFVREGRLKQRTTDGQASGIILSRLKPGSGYAALGLESGDVITGVNGEPVATMKDSYKVYKAMKHGGNVALEVDRQGQLETLELDIR